MPVSPVNVAEVLTDGVEMSLHLGQILKFHTSIVSKLFFYQEILNI